MTTINSVWRKNGPRFFFSLGQKTSGMEGRCTQVVLGPCWVQHQIISNPDYRRCLWLQDKIKKEKADGDEKKKDLKLHLSGLYRITLK